MRVRKLSIENLRGLERFEANELTDFVVIAGPNGCGKTTVLDALRLVKSAYVTDEWKRWFSEHGVNVDNVTNWSKLFWNPDLPAVVETTIQLAPDEHEFLRVHAQGLGYALTLASLPERRTASISGEMPLVPPNLTEERASRLKLEADRYANGLSSALQNGDRFTARVALFPNSRIEIVPSPVATAMFTCFNPERLGEIEFHSSRRLFFRESVDSIRLKVGSRDEERRNKFLYDLENKYRNIKTQLGEEFIASTLSHQNPDDAPLQKSIKELFKTFFPGKQFRGGDACTRPLDAVPCRVEHRAIARY